MSRPKTEMENNVQDKSALAWKKLCDYVEQLAESGGEEFAPAENLGPELYSQIHTLPTSIAKLTKVKKIWLYGSKLKRIPPEIGKMALLEYFDAYTSYDLHWLPYEIINCKNLIGSRISTRALYGNYKFRTPFPKLDSSPVRYDGDGLACSICQRPITYDKTNQLWISLKIGTDVVPLLVNACSTQCEDKLPHPPENYVQFPHKGGRLLKQQPDQEALWNIELQRRRDEIGSNLLSTPVTTDFKEATKELKPLKLIVKLWQK